MVRSSIVLLAALSLNAASIQAQGFNNLYLGTDAGNPAVSTGNRNTALGEFALSSNTSGSDNTAVGSDACRANTIGNSNTAVGSFALTANTTGQVNTAVGSGTLPANTSGVANSGFGVNALNANTIGQSNTALGFQALCPQTGRGRCCWSRWHCPERSTAAYLAGVNGATASGGVQVFVDAAGKLGTVTSSRRFKEDVRDMGEASDGLMQLRPVTFHYKAPYDDGSRLLQYGLIAEEVAKVAPDLVQYDPTGQPLTVRYHALSAMLLNELQKQHAKIEEQAAELARQKAQIQEQEARIQRLEALLPD